MFFKNFKKGNSLIEVVVGTTIISLSLLGLVTTYNIYLSAGFKNTEKIKAGFLTEEGVEAVRSLRDNSWNNISSLPIETSRYLYFDGSLWQATTTNQYIDGIFERSFLLENVYRDVNSDIASSGTLDQNIKKVTVSVSWFNGKATTTKSISTYLTNIFND